MNKESVNSAVREQPFRILWICSHRVHRYEEVNALLRAGAEVIPIFESNDSFPNAIDPNEEDDVLYPKWNVTCSIPQDIVQRIRTIDYYKGSSTISSIDKKMINDWIDVVLVASFTLIAYDFLKWFVGSVVLRAFGGYSYDGVLKPWTIAGHRKTNFIARSNNFFWSPILPYLSFSYDPRITRREIIIPAYVSTERLPYCWAGDESEDSVCEVISLIERYRLGVYQQYLQLFGRLPLKIFGINTKNGCLADDIRIVGTLDDSEYYKQISKCRVMLYYGLNDKNHLHYHPIESLMMKVPLIFFSDGAIAHHARYYGMDEDYLKTAGMCYSVEQALSLAEKCLSSISDAKLLSERQDELRLLFSPDKAKPVIYDFIEKLKMDRNYKINYLTNNSQKTLSIKSHIKTELSKWLQSITG